MIRNETQCDRCGEQIYTDTPRELHTETEDIFQFRPDDRICDSCFYQLETAETENPQPYESKVFNSPFYPVNVLNN